MTHVSYMTTSIIQHIIFSKVGSLGVIQIAGLFMLVFAMFGKFSAIFVTIPTPIIGGIFLVMFGECTEVYVLRYTNVTKL